MSRERDMLLAIFAVQLGHATAEVVMGCATELLRTTSPRQLGALLLERKVITTEQAAILERMVVRALDVTGGDPRLTLELFPAEQQQLVRAMFDERPAGEVKGPALTRELERSPPLPSAEAVCREQPGRYQALFHPDGRPMELGRGAQRVLVVYDSVLGREVALKEFDPRDTSDGLSETLTPAKAAARFLREARLGGQLEHPAVIPVYEVGQRADGRAYYTRLLVRGQTLARSIAAEKTCEARLKLMPAFLTVCQCVAYAHSNGVVHRDLKPQNVMLGSYAEVYLLDWRLARKKNADDPRAGELRLEPDASGSLDLRSVGNPAYLSPEQAWGKVEDLDERSDVWSLGAVLYELLTGRAPYVGATALEVISQIRSVDPEPVESRVKEAPPELTAVCRKALSRDRSLRYENAEALARDVQAWVKGRRVAAHRYSSVELLRRFLRKRRLWVSTVAALVLATVAGAGLGLWRIQRERDQARHFAEVFLDDVTEKLAPVPGVMGLVERVSTSALAHYERTGSLLNGSLDERLRVGRAFVRLCALHCALGRPVQAASSCEFGLRLARGVQVEAPGDARGLTLLADALHTHAQALRLNNDLEGWGRGLEEALPWARSAVAARPDDLRTLELAVLVLSDLGQRAILRTEVKAARGYYEEAVALDQKALSLQTEKDRAAASLSDDYAGLAAVADAEKHLEEAEQLAQKGLSAARQAVELNPKGRENVLSLIKREVVVSDLEQRLGRAGDTSALLADAHARLDRLLVAQPDDQFARVLLLNVTAEQERWEEAYPLLRRIEAAGGLSDVGAIAPAVAFLAGRYDEALRLARLPWLETDGSALLYRALASAMLGRPGDAAIAARALKGHLGGIQWLRGVVVKQLRPGAPLHDSVRRFAAELDEALATADDARGDAALERFISDLEHQIP